MRASLVAAAAVLLAAAGCGSSHTVVRTVTVEHTTATPPQGNQRLYGHVVSLRRRGDHYELRFDPTWFLSGVTANVAQAADQHLRCRPSKCPAVANDNYVVDESHRVYTFVVPAKVTGTVLTRHGTAGGPFPATRITVSQLAQIVAAKSSLRLFEPLSSGVWILVRIDTVRTFAQQYVP